jgi:hypothetical protein
LLSGWVQGEGGHHTPRDDEGLVEVGRRVHHQRFGSQLDPRRLLEPRYFADRARREVLATGETVRKRTVDTRDKVTAQEAQIAAGPRGTLE